MSEPSENSSLNQASKRAVAKVYAKAIEEGVIPDARQQRFANQRVFLMGISARVEHDLLASEFRGSVDEFHVLVELQTALRIVTAMANDPSLKYSFADARLGGEFVEPSAADLEKVLPDENGHA